MTTNKMTHTKIQSLTQAGLSLVELLVALGLGLLITAAVMQVFLSSRQTERLEQALSQVQDNGRFAMNLLVSDLQRVGYLGCNTPQYRDEYKDDQTRNVNIIATNTGMNAASFSQDALSGFEYSGGVTFSPVPPTTLKTYLEADNILQNRGVANSDVVSFYYGKEEQGVTLAADYAGSSGNDIKITNNSGCLMRGDDFMLSNCSVITIARISNTLSPECSSAETSLKYAAPDNNPAMITESYSTATSRFMSMNRVTYYVADTGRTDSENRSIRALYRRINNTAAQEIIDGVESMQIEYGEQFEGSNNTRFTTANTAGLEMGRVFSVRIGLLIRSTENALADDDKNSYDLPGRTIGEPTSTETVKHAGGKVLRRAFITTVQLRNRT